MYQEEVEGLGLGFLVKIPNLLLLAQFPALTPASSFLSRHVRRGSGMAQPSTWGTWIVSLLLLGPQPVIFIAVTGKRSFSHITKQSHSSVLTENNTASSCSCGVQFFTYNTHLAL